MNSQIGQQFLIGISGHSLTADEKKFIIKNNISGVTLFGRNIKEPQQILDLCKEIQSLRHQMVDRLPLFIGIDMEGGRVARLKSPFTQWPPLKKLGDMDSPVVSFHFSYSMGKELRAMGINLNYAPCTDVLTNPLNKVIGDRALSEDPQKVAKHISALIRGYIKANVLPCVKHFPGHGNTLLDSHEDLPVENSDEKRLNEIELVPFNRAIKSRIDFVMTSHILFKNIDPDWPVTLSEIFIKNILREQLRFKSIVISDDLGMKALTKNYDLKKIPVRCLQVGVNLLLYCNEPETPPLAIEAVEKALADGELKPEVVQKNFEMISALKKEKLKNPDPLLPDAAFRIIGHPDHYRISQAISEGNVPTGLAVDTEF